MSGKEYLWKIREMSEVVKTYEEEYETLMSRLTSVTYKQKDVNIMKSKEDFFPETVEKMSEIKDIYFDALNEYAKMRIYADRTIRQMQDHRHKAVLIKYYFQHKTLEQVAEEMDISYRWVCDLKDMALKEFEKKFKK